MLRSSSQSRTFQLLFSLSAFVVAGHPANGASFTFTQDFAGTIRQFGTHDGNGLGAPFDGSQTGQSFQGSLSFTNLQLSGPGTQIGPFTTYVATGPSVLSIQFPTTSFVISGVSSDVFIFGLPNVPGGSYSLTVDAGIKPSGSLGSEDFFALTALANQQFFSSGDIGSLPTTLDTSLATTAITGSFSITGAAGRSSGTNLLFSNLSAAPEPSTSAMCGLPVVALLLASWFARRRLVKQRPIS